MPAAEVTDQWEAIERQYVLGATIQSLAEQFKVQAGTIVKRAQRKGWTSLRMALSNKVREAKSEKLVEASKEVREALSEELSASVRQLRATERKSGLKPLTERLNATTQITNNAKTVFGWTDTNTTTLVDLHLLDQPASPIIDVVASSTEPEQNKATLSQGQAEQVDPVPPFDTAPSYDI